MHELSIARALLNLAAQRVPPGSRLRTVRLRAGALRCIDPVALHWAWQAATQGAAARACSIELIQLPWRICCEDCGQTFDSDRPFAPCPCGGSRQRPVGGDELILESIDVESTDPDCSGGVP
jgi:hydrogenase nickel incorporation protein HypA/HybF